MDVTTTADIPSPPVMGGVVMSNSPVTAFSYYPSKIRKEGWHKKKPKGLKKKC